MIPETKKPNILKPKKTENPNPNPKNEKDSSSNINESEKILEDYKDIKNENELKQQRKKRKTKADIEAEKEHELQAESFAQSSTVAVHIGLSMLFERMPNPKPLTQEEQVAFDTAFTDLAKKYFSTIQKFGEELNFIMILGFLILPRLKNDKQDSNSLRKNGDGKNDVSKGTDKR